MKRLGISVEGPSERDFVRHVLAPHLIELGGWAVVKAVVLGGGVSLARVKTELRALASNYDCMSTLYDLYGFHGRTGRNAEEMEGAIAAHVGVPHLVPYVQSFEFEALLLSSPAVLVAQLGGSDGLIAQIRQAVAQHGGPERVNGGYDTCPSRRLAKWFTGYDKVVHGPPIMREIGLQVIRAHCPRFDAWVRRLEEFER